MNDALHTITMYFLLLLEKWWPPQLCQFCFGTHRLLQDCSCLICVWICFIASLLLFALLVFHFEGAMIDHPHVIQLEGYNFQWGAQEKVELWVLLAIYPMIFSKENYTCIKSHEILRKKCHTYFIKSSSDFPLLIVQVWKFLDGFFIHQGH